ncbi:protein downstream neighbor of son homolog isoform X1 [Macrobrachium nipponense]|uniref:protein downstream neighbor of son homolog isoform X1 n=1 Tax=Macrobrachium nipponense TaxID=159736 RepID=UPI0030C810E3
MIMNRDSSAKSPAWIRPEDVMKVRKLKAKRKALQARMISSTNTLQILAPVHGQTNDSLGQGVKRRNPFKCSPNKKSKLDDDSNLDITSDASLFRLLNPSEGKDSSSTTGKAIDFSSFFNKELGTTTSSPVDDGASKQTWTHKLVVDWSLKTKIRFRSLKPLPWKHNFKTSEEASGTTGFVRCLSSASEENEDRTLDTSANAKFYQCCLIWQHPNLPWLQLFPRDNVKISSQTGLFGNDQKLADSLHAEWSESVRSLHQLLRVRQCPYFYMCGPTFTCLFRAAGVAGISQMHALISPTTRGFREAMKNEDIEFEMPFHNASLVKGGSEQKGELGESDSEDQLGTELEEEGEEAKSWLEDLGVETSQFPNLNPSRVKLERVKYKNIDSTPTSLVYVEGMEIQGLVNFLLNSRSCISTVGPLAGVPPTLLSPVAFQGGSLKTLKTKGNTIHQDGETHYSMEVMGPIMPHTIHQLTSLLCTSLDEFSFSCNPVIATQSFSKYKCQEDSCAPQAFAQEGLVDCGLDSCTRSLICTPPGTKELELPLTYREVTYKAEKYTWSNKL